MRPLASNGSNITEKSKFSWAVLLIIVGVVTTLGGFAYNLQSSVAVHCGNPDIHHPTTQLNQDYMRSDVAERNFNEIMRRLDRIESKLDR